MTDRMRWDCAVDGCYRKKKCPRLSEFDDCFPGSNCMTDIDGAIGLRVHRDDRVLFLEWKSVFSEIPVGQRLFFERLTRLSDKITVVVVVGKNDTMRVLQYSVFSNGKKGPDIMTDREEDKDALKEWLGSWAKGNVP